MTVAEYIHRKNAIIEEVTGKTLVPDDQIIECKQVPLAMNDDSTTCPYCAIYAIPNESCKGCPMFEIENCPTYYSIIMHINGSLVAHPVIGDKLEELINEYNSELKYE